jgi:hypothetical protein
MPRTSTDIPLGLATSGIDARAGNHVQEKQYITCSNEHMEHGEHKRGFRKQSGQDNGEGPSGSRYTFQRADQGHGNTLIKKLIYRVWGKACGQASGKELGSYKAGYRYMG